jgi:hypothetical protein
MVPRFESMAIALMSREYSQSAPSAYRNANAAEKLRLRISRRPIGMNSRQRMLRRTLNRASTLDIKPGLGQISQEHFTPTVKDIHE